MPLTATAVAGVVKGGIDYFSAKAQEKKDKAELAGLDTPFYKIQDEYFQNRNNAAEMAQGGLSQDAKDFYTDQSGRGLGAGISGTLQSGGSPNDIARIFDSYNQGIKQVSVADSEAKINNIKYFNQVNKDLAGQKTTQWGVNEYQPYQNKLKELTQRISADKQNANNAINSAIGSVSSFATAKSNEDMIGSLFGDGKGGVSELPDGNAMWEQYKSQMEMDGAAQGNYTLPGKFNTEKSSSDFYVPDELGLSEEQKQGLYSFLKRGR